MHTKNFRLYLFSDVIAQICGVAAGIAVPIVAFRFSGSITLAGVLGTISGLAALLGGIIGGAAADKYNRKPVIMGANVVAALCNLGLAFVVVQGEATFSAGAFATLLGLSMFAHSIGQASANPSLPQLVAAEDIATAQGFIQARMQFAGLIGRSSVACCWISLPHSPSSCLRQVVH
ncbi:hypothetical protein NG00_00337 [Corynebacterium camporealensis]|uniref:Major Facilitator Superfamily transporter n=1 Tax=Corynebacterium camporealensis TaxID=161896 RepID=A0A0F6QUQ8_9CORY|nr:MFS transporter [Corynebacterium camporealensis]AKE38362.1 hypothetical protein UL81_01905 [Corynebacterium camporealensis]AVH87666.1 hypothetical protein NG00_00337 [Corynebacterium camporealensis]